MSQPLVKLGIPQQDIDKLKEAPLSFDEESSIEKLEELNELEDDILSKVKDAEERILIIQGLFEIHELAMFDFDGMIYGLHRKFQDGTREWFFDKLSNWFDDEKSRVMILTAGPGIGKSVLSAKVCELYKQRGQLAGCHFCDFRNADARNPHKILESLASQLCDNVDGFLDKLTYFLDREHSRDSLLDAFRVLLNDPLHALDRREPMLIVVDALDKSVTDVKSEFLELISEKFPKLPKWIKMLITSRPELQLLKKLQHLNPLEISIDDHNHKDEEQTGRILFEFKSENGELVGSPLDLPLDTSAEQLQELCRALLPQEKENVHSFFVNGTEITSSIRDVLNQDVLETEKVVEIIYQPQAIFRVRAVSRCTSTITGHAEAVLSVAFSNCGRYLASGSGDTTVRFWDLTTETPQFICKGHKHWILCIAWSCDGKKLVSGCKNGEIILWNPETGEQWGKTLKGHRQWITALSWEPLHRNPTCRNLASSSKDSTIKIWDTSTTRLSMTLCGHTQSVTCVKWGGEGLIYSASQDRTIKVWKAENGMLCRTLQGHGHWVNTMALNTDYAIRTGAFDPVQISKNTSAPKPLSENELKQKAFERYQKAKGTKTEKLVSGSDDFTLFLWEPEENKKSIARMTGHQGLINDVMFSPDGRLIASASFDKSIKLWDGNTGTYLASLRGHVNPVYQIAWSADSRLLVSASADSTLKVWNVKTRKLEKDLPGHADEVYAVDWSPDGTRVASGGKDKVLKLWRS